MAEKVLGIAHLFGVSGSYANATVMSASIDESPLIDVTTEDEQGRRIEVRLDDDKKDLSLTLKGRLGFSLPEIGDIVIWESISYYVRNVGEAQANKEMVVFTLKAEFNEYLVLGA